MDTGEGILDSLSTAQRAEFERDIAEMAKMLTIQLQGKPDKVAETKINLRLQGEVYLNATIIFHRDNNEKFTAMVEKLHRFNNVDEYLDAINDSKNTTDGFKKLK
jgi:hypothetical protein